MTFPHNIGRALKILHIGKYFAPFNGGLENYQRDAMVALAARGIQSAALVHQHKLSLSTKKETLEAHGLQLPVVRTATWAKLLFTPISPGFFWQLLRQIKTFQPDLLHLHMPNPSVFWALLCPSARRLPWVVHWHSDVITEQQDWKMKFFYQIYRHFERAVLKRAVVIVATSPPYLESSLPLRPWKSKCQVVPLGVDPGRLSTGVLQTDTGTSETDPPAALQVLAIGRLTYYKGFKYLIEAAVLAANIHVHLIGRGDEEQALKSLAASLNVLDRVTFHGTLNAEELARIFRQCDCLCLPSIERTEAFGMVLLEAQYFAKATVISDVPGSGMGWVVDHPVTGLKVPLADAQSLAEALLRLDNNRTELASMGLRGKQKFEREFDINHAIKDLITVYQKALGGKPGPTAD